MPRFSTSFDSRCVRVPIHLGHWSSSCMTSHNLFPLPLHARTRYTRHKEHLHLQEHTTVARSHSSPRSHSLPPGSRLPPGSPAPCPHRSASASSNSAVDSRLVRPPTTVRSTAGNPLESRTAGTTLWRAALARISSSLPCTALARGHCNGLATPSQCPRTALLRGQCNSNVTAM